MPVPTAITDLSTTAAANSPAGSDPIRPDLDNYLRALSAFIAQNYASLATKQSSLGYTPVNKAGDTMTGAQAFTKGSVGAPGIAFSGDTNTGIHSSGADILDLVTAGVAQWRVDASGRLLCPARSQPCFRGIESANRTAAGVFDTYSETDDGSNFNPTTGIFTAPVDGWYEFSASVCVSAQLTSGSVKGTAYITDGNANTLAVGSALFITGFDTVHYIGLSSGPHRLSAGATVWTRFDVTGTGSATYGNSYCSHFSGRLLG